MKYEDVRVLETVRIKISPERAREMLEKNTANRTLSQRIVNRYAEDMVKGDWRETHQGIAIDQTGRIVDGQHRLEAVAKSGVPILTWVTTYAGEVSAIMLPVDRGKGRTTSDLTGLTSQQVSLVTTIWRFAKVLSKASSPQAATEIWNAIAEPCAKVEGACGLSVNTSTSPNSESGLRRVWQVSVKAAAVTAAACGHSLERLLDFETPKCRTKAACAFMEMQTECRSYGWGAMVQSYLAAVFYTYLLQGKGITLEDIQAIEKARIMLREDICAAIPGILDM